MMRQRGISLIELIIFIVIISVALTGILLVMNQTTAHSAAGGNRVAGFY